MLNYGPIIVTLSTSKYSLVEIRGVFYKSAYRGNFILSYAINFCIIPGIHNHLICRQKTGSRNSPNGIYTLSSTTQVRK